MKKYFIYSIIAALLSFTLNACKKEIQTTNIDKQEFAVANLNALVKQVKIWCDSIVKYEIIKSENNIKSLTSKPDDITLPIINWELAFKNFDSTSLESITVPLNYNISTGELLQLVATVKKETINGYLIRQIPDSLYYSVHPDILDMSGFTGTYIIYDLLGHCIVKLKFESGIISSDSKHFLLNGEIKSNGITPPCAGCDLQTVIVTGYRNTLNDLTRNIGGLGAFAITTYNGNYNGNNNGVVIAGGTSVYNSSLLSLISIPNGECVFGSLAYIAQKLKFVADFDPDIYIAQWAKKYGLSINEMKYKLDNVQSFRPGFKDAADLLNKNFIVQPLKSNDDVLSEAKKGFPIFVLIDWKDGLNNGHCVVLEWDNINNSLSYYDSINDKHTLIEVGDSYYSKIKYFYSVHDINYDSFGL